MRNPTINPTDIDGITERITHAVMEHRLLPGSKLLETPMATAFGVSRTKIRQVLTVLAKKGLVVIFPNRGAFVASPTAEEARELFATRRLLEPEVIRGVIANAQQRDFKRLNQHLSEERQAREKQDRRSIIRLSGDFHVLLASLSGNRFIERMMGELCPLTCLIISLYDQPQTPACPENEHDQIVAAIAQKDEQTAIKLMLHHLAHIENTLQLDSLGHHDVDWRLILN